MLLVGNGPSCEIEPAAITDTSSPVAPKSEESEKEDEDVDAELLAIAYSPASDDDCCYGDNGEVDVALTKSSVTILAC